NDGSYGRDLTSILLTCVGVIAISMWASFHPNVPDVKYVGKSALGNFLNELISIGITFVAPELVILWAMRQRYSAQKLKVKYKELGWSNSHGFLALMSGIGLYNADGHLICYLQDKAKFD
ncbi:hypothetical protein L218DRAFT_839560, partial [Marasmius fiardii PR-910]